jgi:hypothetical protein
MARLLCSYRTNMRSRYDRHMVMDSFKNDASFTMCLGPNCNSGQLHEGGIDQPIMKCNACHFKTCFVHNLPWHSGETCAQFDLPKDGAKERLEQEVASKALLEQTAKRCPNSKCGVPIVKVNGCDHMTCKSNYPLVCQSIDSNKTTKVVDASTSFAGYVFARGCG